MADLRRLAGRLTALAGGALDRYAPDGGRWLVAPYGTVAWVHNARAAGRVELRRGRRAETCRLAELPPDEAAPVLRAYLRNVAIVRPFFDVTTRSPLADFVAEAPRHPVFRLERIA